MLKISQTLAEHDVFEEICLIGISTSGKEERVPLGPKRSVWRIPGKRSKPAGTIGKALHILLWSRNVWRALRSARPVCVNAHSLSVLPLGVLLKRIHGAKLVYDTHELETETSASRGLRRYLSKVAERLLIRHVDEVSVVNETIAGWYRDEYGLPRVHVVRNVPPIRVGLPNRLGSLRKGLGIPSDSLIFLYQGVISDGRGIARLLEVFATGAPDRHVVFMGYGQLEDSVRTASARHSNIHLQPAVPPEQLASFTADADVGLSLIESISLSYYYCLPNKLFEYLSAGLPVIASDLPCMREVILKYRCGWTVSANGTSLATLVSTIGHADVQRLRPNALAVQDDYNWEREVPALLAMYETMFGRRVGAHASP